MKKYFILSVVFVACLFLFTGCEKKESEYNTESKFDLQQVDEKNITVEMANVLKDSANSGTVEVAAGEGIVIDYKLEGMDTVKVNFYQVDDTGNKKDFGYSDLNGEGNEKTEDIDAGTYELEFVVESDTATGSFKAYAE